jgi:hypothetical protein
MPSAAEETSGNLSAQRMETETRRQPGLREHAYPADSEMRHEEHRASAREDAPRPH